MIISQDVVDLNSKADATVINGVLTGFAIIFGFVSIEIREIKASTFDKFLLIMPLISFFIFGISKYCGEVVSNGYPLYWSLLSFFAGIIFSACYSILILYARDRYDYLREMGKI